MKKIILTTLIFLTALQAQAFEDFILSTDGKVSNIKIEDPSVVNINPLTTILNEKNTLFIIPQKTGETSFSLQKEGEVFSFNIKIDENETLINEIEGFELISLDTHPVILDCEIDAPPVYKEKETINIDGAIIEVDSINEEVE